MAVPSRQPGSASRRYDQAVKSAVAVRRRVDQGIVVLGKLVPLSRRISRFVGVFVALVGGASLTILGVLLWRFWPTSVADAVAYLILAALLLAPVVMLWLFHRALAEVVELPARLVAVPDLARDHGSELAGLVRDAQVRRGGLRLVSVPGDLWRAGRLLLAAHDDLPGYGAVLTIVSVPFLVGSLVAAATGLGLILLAPAVLAGGVLTAVI